MNLITAMIGACIIAQITLVAIGYAIKSSIKSKRNQKWHK